MFHRSPNFKSISIALALSMSCLSAFADDGPDLAKEKRLHDIYMRYNVNPTNEQLWSGATGGKAQTYQVQKGDTLWDLSTTLFAQSDFWPKVWSLNSEKVQNPHEINPQQVIQFFPGTLGEAPQLMVTQIDPNAPPPEITPASLAALKPSEPDLPERLKNPTPVSPLPDTLPNWKFREDIKVAPEFEPFPKRTIPNPEEFLPYYVTIDSVTTVGQIMETELGGKTAGDFQYVYVKIPSDTGEKNFLVIKEMGQIKDNSSGQSARLIEVQGEIEILELINSEKSLYRALVKRTLVPMELGSNLMSGSIPKFTAEGTDAEAQAMARVIGGEFALRREMFANRGIIFLSGTGLDVNQVYPIYKVQKLRNPGTSNMLNDRLIGKVKVIQVSGNFATAVVLDSKEDILVGDITNPDVPASMKTQ